MLISGSVVDILLCFFYIVRLNQCLWSAIWSLLQGSSTCCNLQNIGEAVSGFQQNSNSSFYKSLHAYMNKAPDAYYASAMILVGLFHVLTAVLHIVTLRMLDIMFKEAQM